MEDMRRTSWLLSAAGRLAAAAMPLWPVQCRSGRGMARSCHACDWSRRSGTEPVSAEATGERGTAHEVGRARGPGPRSGAAGTTLAGSAGCRRKSWDALPFQVLTCAYASFGRLGMTCPENRRGGRLFAFL